VQSSRSRSRERLVADRFNWWLDRSNRQVAAAERHLLAAARIDDPDPALRTFGPDMSLAQAA
jgi:hypothetical protein